MGQSYNQKYRLVCIGGSAHDRAHPDIGYRSSASRHYFRWYDKNKLYDRLQLPLELCVRMLKSRSIGGLDVRVHGVDAPLEGLYLYVDVCTIDDYFLLRVTWVPPEEGRRLEAVMSRCPSEKTGCKSVETATRKRGAIFCLPYRLLSASCGCGNAWCLGHWPIEKRRGEKRQ